MKNLLNKIKGGFTVLALAGLISGISGGFVTNNAKDYFIERVKSEGTTKPSYTKELDYKTKIGNELVIYGASGAVIGAAGLLVTSVAHERKKRKNYTN